MRELLCFTVGFALGCGLCAYLLIEAWILPLCAIGLGLVLGGILYSIGGVLYAAKWPGRNNPRFGCHEIFHVFILLGSICHFWLIYQIIAPM